MDDEVDDTVVEEEPVVVPEATEKQKMADALKKSAVHIEVRKNDPRDRMSVIIQLAHERVRGRGPRGKRVTGSVYLDGKEQAYERDHVGSVEPQPFDKGFVAVPGYVLLDVWNGDGELLVERDGIKIAGVSKARPFAGDLAIDDKTTWRMVDCDEMDFTVTVIPR